MSQINVKFIPGAVTKTSANVANGYAALDASGKILSSILPAGALGGLSFKGSWDASTGAYPTSPTNGDFYVVSVAGTLTGTAYNVGDYFFWSSTNTAWQPIHDPTTSDQISEGSVHQFFTNARSQAASVVNSLSGGQTNQAPSVSSVSAALAGKDPLQTAFRQKFTLASGDITSGYVVLSNLISGNIVASVKGLGIINRSPTDSSSDTDADYYISTDGGSGNSKLTWINDLSSGGATPLAAGDVIFIQSSHT